MASNARAERVDSGLRKLIANLLPDNPSLSEQELEELEAQREDQWHRLRPELDDTGPSTQPDIHEVSDAIRKRLWRTRNSPEPAVRFSNIYSRLLTMPILERKGGILQLFYSLADQDEDDGEVEPPRAQALPQSPLAQPFSPFKADTARTPATATTAFQRPRSSLAEASSARLNQQSAPETAPKSLRDQYAGSRAETRPHTSQQIHQNSQTAAENQPGHTDDGILVNKSPSETMLLRDLPFTLQGLSTGNLAFSTGESMALPVQLPLPLV